MARKPMSEDQRAAAGERLAAARAARGHDGSASVHETLRGVDEDSPLHWKKVKVWIKEIQLEVAAKKRFKDSKDRSERAEYIKLSVYLKNLKSYLAGGIYQDHRYGRHGEGTMKTIVTTMAYHSDGYPKRTVGFYYPDIGGLQWTKEMENECQRDRGIW